MHEFLNDSYDEKISDNPIMFTKYFDENWVQGRGKDYTVTVTVEEENLNSGSLVSINISAQRTKPYPFIKKGGQDIYSVDSKKFFSLNRRCL